MHVFKTVAIMSFTYTDTDVPYMCVVFCFSKGDDNYTATGINKTL